MKTNANGNAYVKDCLLQALIELMDEKPFQEISISDITRRANVSRMAYYRNYSSKEDILISHLKEEVRQYVQFAQPNDSGELRITQKNIARLFEHCKEERRFILACDNAGLGYYFLDAFTAYLHRYFIQKEERRDYILNAYASALYSTIVKWLRKGAGEATEEMAEILHGIYGPHV